MCTFAKITVVLSFCVILSNTTQYDQISSVSSNYGIQLGAQIQPDTIAFPSSIEPKSNYYQHHHHHNYHNFEHSHDFHHHHHPHDHGENNESSEDNVQDNSKSDSSTIPLELMWKYNNFTDVNDLLLNLVEGTDEMEEEGGPELILASRFGGVERSAAIMPKAASCIPEAQTVKIVANEDPSVLYIPSCTRIERCGGCCSHSLLACQPTETETVNFQVVKTQFVGGSKLKYMGKEVIPVEKHTKCKCGCKVQEKDCNSFQQYRQSECRCACTNTDEEKKCYKENSTKLWNPDVCACQCRNILQCSTGYTFNTLQCKCMPVFLRRRDVEMPEVKRTGYKSQALPVLPLDETENVKP